MIQKTLIETHTVPNNITPIRLQEYGIGVFKTIPTRSGFKKAIKKGLVLINGQKGSTALFISGGEKIELYQENTINKFSKELKLPLKVHYEDDFLAIIEKPAGVLVSGNSFVTIYNALPQNLKASSQTDATHLTPVHRLDYPTSGLLLIGKTTNSIRALNKLFEEKEILKIYYAITIGKMISEGSINLPIDNKEAFTKYRVEKTVASERFQYLNLVKLTPFTGRKHQLRKHLFSINNPILGDRDYHLPDKLLKGKGLYLHAKSLEFTHPINKQKIKIISELPKKFKKIFPEE